MPRFPLRNLIVAAVAVLLPAAAFARDYGVSARATALGEAMTAIGMGVSGLNYNPAALAQGIQYSVNAGYGFDNVPGAHDFHVALADSQTNSTVAMGASYTLAKSTVSGASFLSHDVRAGLAAHFGGGGADVAIGGGFRYIKASGDVLSLSAPTIDLGLLLTVAQRFHLGVAGMNLVSVSGNYAPRLLNLGAGFSSSMVNVGVDVVFDFDSKGSMVVSPAAGLEFVAGGALAIRAGFTLDRVTDAKRVCGGIGYISQYVGADIGYSHDATSKEGWRIQGTLRVFLP